MKKTCNSSYLRHKKVGWNEEILEFGLLQYIYGPADKILNVINVFHRCRHNFFRMKALIFLGAAHQTMWEV